MNHLTHLAMSRGDRLICTGYALNTIADLLGCDGCDHGLTDKQLNGLHHAIKALAGFVETAGFDLAEAAEQEAKQ